MRIWYAYGLQDDDGMFADWGSRTDCGPYDVPEELYDAYKAADQALEKAKRAIWHHVSETKQSMNVGIAQPKSSSTRIRRKDDD